MEITLMSETRLVPIIIPPISANAPFQSKINFLREEFSAMKFNLSKDKLKR